MFAYGPRADWETRNDGRPRLSVTEQLADYRKARVALAQEGQVSKKGAHNDKDPELLKLAQEFLKTYKAAAATSAVEFRRILRTGGFSGFEGGVVELTADVSRSLSKLVARGAKLLGARAANEKALGELAEASGQKLVVGKLGMEAAVADLVKCFFGEGSAAFEFLLPNYLIQFDEGVRSITVGRVRAMVTEDFSLELARREPRVPVQIAKGPGFWHEIRDGKHLIELRPVCWVVKVSATQQNVEEEAKWLIDVGISLLRAHYKSVGGRFPGYGDIESHPWRPGEVRQVGVKIEGSRASAGAMSLPSIYEINKTIEAITLASSFRTNSALIFDPPGGSLAERVSQGLGWLTRGRQAEDRAERLLYYFTAIEALLSSDDKTAPVVQTISRNPAVIWSEDIATRVGISKELRRLYELRSAIVHAGNRQVVWGNANLAQYIAEGLFCVVLRKGELTIKHQTFIEQLSIASYGTPWPAAVA